MAFLNSRHESIWLASYIFYVIWALLFAFAPLFSEYSSPVEAAEATGEADARNKGTQQGQAGSSSEYADVEHEESTQRAMRAADRAASRHREGFNMQGFSLAARDSFLLLFGAVLMTQFGHGVDYKVLVLIWTSFTVLAVWSLSNLGVSHRAWVGDFLGIFAATGLLIAVWALAFRGGVVRTR